MPSIQYRMKAGLYGAIGYFNMKFKVLLLMCVLFSLPVLSAGTEGFVERIYPYNGQVYFRLKDDPCKSTPGNTYWQFNLDSEISKAWFSMLLSASATNTKIKLGSPADCDASINQEIAFIYQDF